MIFGTDPFTSRGDTERGVYRFYKAKDARRSLHQLRGGFESQLFRTERSRCAGLVCVHLMVYGVDDGKRCIVIAHMVWVSICVVH